jgi:hypothetical protein
MFYQQHLFIFSNCKIVVNDDMEECEGSGGGMFGTTVWWGLNKSMRSFC